MNRLCLGWLCLLGCTPDVGAEVEPFTRLEPIASSERVAHPCVGEAGELLYDLQPASGWPTGVGTGGPQVLCRDGGALLAKVFRYEGAYYTNWRSEYWRDGYGMEHLDRDTLRGGEGIVDATGSYHPSYVGFPMGDIPIPEGSRLKFEVVHKSDSGTRAFWYKDIPPGADIGLWVEQSEQSVSRTCPASNPDCEILSEFHVDEWASYRVLKFGFGLPESTAYGLHAFVDIEQANHDSSLTPGICSDTLNNSPDSAWNEPPGGGDPAHFGHGMRIWLAPPE